MGVEKLASMREQFTDAELEQMSSAPSAPSTPRPAQPRQGHPAPNRCGDMGMMKMVGNAALSRA